jgi:multisubunit Na+/H+ antiporter MnhE subunit
MPAVRTWLLWWAALTALYVVLVDSRRLQELVAAAVIGALGATAALVVRHGSDRALRPRTLVRELRSLRQWPRDLVLLARALVRRPRGRIVEVPFEADPADAAVAVAARTLAPNRIVIDVDLERGVLRYHELEEQRPPSTRAEGTQRTRGGAPWA